MEDLWRTLRVRWNVYREARGLFREADREFRRGEFKTAADLYGKGLEHDGGRHVARFNMALALYKSGSRREAREQWKIVLEQVEGKNEYLAEQTRIMLRQFG